MSEHSEALKERLKKLGVNSKRIDFALKLIRNTHLDPATSIEDLVEFFHQETKKEGAKGETLKVLCDISYKNEILPKFYRLSGVIEPEITPHSRTRLTATLNGTYETRSRVHIVSVELPNQTGDVKIKGALYCEIILGMRFSDKHLLPFLGVSENVPGQGLCIISRLLENGDIIQYIKKAGSGVNRFELLEQAALGLKYLHLLGIVHTGVRPENIFIGKDKTACLGDYGISGVLSKSEVVGEISEEAEHFFRYMAPELMGREKYTRESDIYSLGTTIYRIIAGYLPYPHDSYASIVRKIDGGQQPERPPGFQKAPWTMVGGCWKKEPKERLEIGLVIEQLAKLKQQAT